MSGPETLSAQILEENRVGPYQEALKQPLSMVRIIASAPRTCPRSYFRCLLNWGGMGCHPRGNFEGYLAAASSGRSEKMLRDFIAERGLRDQLVLATKAGFTAGNGLQAGGSSAKHLSSALDGSLRCSAPHSNF